MNISEYLKSGRTVNQKNCPRLARIFWALAEVDDWLRDLYTEHQLRVYQPWDKPMQYMLKTSNEINFLRIILFETGFKYEKMFEYSALRENWVTNMPATFEKLQENEKRKLFLPCWNVALSFVNTIYI